MKLLVQAFAGEKVLDRIDPLGDHQGRPGVAFGNKVSQGPPDRAGHADELAVLMDDGKLPVDLPHAFDIARGDTGDGLVLGHIQKNIRRRIGQIDESFNQGNLLHGALEFLSLKRLPGAGLRLAECRKEA
jgi:hypothetical protein